MLRLSRLLTATAGAAADGAAGSTSVSTVARAAVSSQAGNHSHGHGHGHGHGHAHGADSTLKEFDRDQVVTPAAANFTFNTHVPGTYNVFTTPNGGFLLSLAARGISKVIGPAHPDPLCMTASFLARSTTDAPAEITVHNARSGRTTSTAMASVSQGGRQRLVVTSTWCNLEAMAGPNLVERTKPEVAPIEECIESGESEHIQVINRLRMFIDPRFVGCAKQGAGMTIDTDKWERDKARFAGYVQHKDGRELDVFSLLFLADATPPPVLNLSTIPQVWLPTMELSVHVRRRPAPGWLMFNFQASENVNGVFEIDGELWDSTGKLVAMSRQLAMMVPVPTTHAKL